MILWTYSLKSYPMFIINDSLQFLKCLLYGKMLSNMYFLMLGLDTAVSEYNLVEKEWGRVNPSLIVSLGLKQLENWVSEVHLFSFNIIKLIFDHLKHLKRKDHPWVIGAIILKQVS